MDSLIKAHFTQFGFKELMFHEEKIWLVTPLSEIRAEISKENATFHTSMRSPYEIIMMDLTRR